MIHEPIVIDQEQIDPNACATCDNCEWRGRAVDLDPADGAILTPGDEVPAGRCPECFALAYLDKE